MSGPCKLVRSSLSQTNVGGDFEEVEEIVAVSYSRVRLVRYFKENFPDVQLGKRDGTYGYKYDIEGFDAIIVD
jgi:hypothetical protein